jgi:hypothetical protein
MVVLGSHPELLFLLSHHYPGPAWVMNGWSEALVELSCGDGDHRRHVIWTERETLLLRASCSWGQCHEHLRSVGIQSMLGVGRRLRFLECDGNPSGVVSGRRPPVVVFSLEPRPTGPHKHRHNIEDSSHLVFNAGDLFR